MTTMTTPAQAQAPSGCDSADDRAALRFECGSDGVAILTFDRPNSGANIFDRSTLEALDHFLAGLAERENLRGLILCSAKPQIFIAGADIDSVLCNADPEETTRLIQLGQDVFQRLSAMPFPTVAAIHGACLGGGYEMALACDYRIATPDRVTKIGLPETLLGIVPAWGGSTRLPRLIGFPRALDLILGGKTVPAKLAKKRGMIDAVVPREHLESFSRRLIERGKAPRLRRPLLNCFPASRVIQFLAKRRLQKKTRGCYPALPAALRLITQNLGLPESKALANERRVVQSLAKSPEARALIDVFRLRERAKKLGRHQHLDSKSSFRSTAVIGAGVMGAGIAHWCSSRGLATTLTDISSEQLARGMKLIVKRYAQGVKRRALTPAESQQGLDRITPFLGPFSLEHHGFVIEAAVEKMPVKKAIFRDLESRIGSHTILATNTSALSISDLAGATSCPDRVVGIHFFNPVHRMPLVEIVRGRDTSEETLQRTLSLIHKIGKLPVVVRDSPGFVVNRLLMPYMIEAGRLLESGVALEVIDEAMLDFGMPMGPLRLLDEVGLDVALHVADTLREALGDRMRSPDIIQQLIDQTRMGRKSNHGFYDYGKRVQPAPSVSSGNRSMSSQHIQERLVAVIINEAARCLEEEVVQDPRDIDFAMIMGTGFAPFRGGPLRHADAHGLTAVLRALQAAEAEPAPLLSAMAAKNQSFYPKSS